jgi:hypothetical protein
MSARAAVMVFNLGWMGFFTDMTLSLIVLSSINDVIITINTYASYSVDLNGLGCAFVLASAKPVAPGFIRDPAYVICFVDIEYLLGAHLDAGPAGGAQVFVYNYCLIHFGTPLFNPS